MEGGRIECILYCTVLYCSVIRNAAQCSAGRCGCGIQYSSGSGSGSTSQLHPVGGRYVQYVCTVLVYTLRRGRCRESVTPILRYSVRLTLRPSLSSVSVVPTVTHGKAKYRSKGETDVKERERERQEANGG